MKRLLWCMGWPAAYYRRLHSIIDDIPDIKSQYLYYPYNDEIADSRRYEEGIISKNAIIVNKDNEYEVDSIIRQYLNDKDAVVVVCGTYPRGLIKIINKLRWSKCIAYYSCDDNLYDRCKMSFLMKMYQIWIVNAFDGYLQIGITNAFYYLYLLGKKKLARKEIVHCPYPHFEDEVNCDGKEVCPGGVVRFLYLGRIIPVKNVLALVHAAKVLKMDNVENFTIEIAGDGSDVPVIKDAIDKNKLNKTIVLSGLVNTSKRQEVFFRNDVFVLASHREPWGLVVNEALSAGLPVITPFWTGAASDLIIDGVTGIKLKNNDYRNIAEALKIYCKNTDLLKKQSKLASFRVKDRNFTHEACVSAVRKICVK